MHNQDGTTGMAGHKHSLDPAVRKQELLREGEFFRSSVVHARAQVRHAARPEVMLHGVMDPATWVLRARADAMLKPTGPSVSLPLTRTMLFSSVSRKSCRPKSLAMV